MKQIENLTDFKQREREQTRQIDDLKREVSYYRDLAEQSKAKSAIA